MNSREKGKRGERWWRDELRANGYTARRGQQFCGSPDSPDVVCEELSWIHFEVKFVERLNIEDAMDQARRDCERGATSPRPSPPEAEREKTPTPVLVHKKNHRRGLVTMDVETFFRLLRGDFPASGTQPTKEDKIWAEGHLCPTEVEEPLRGNGPASSQPQNFGTQPFQQQKTENQ